MSDFSKIQLALAQVRDIIIDPNTGATIQQSNRSLLEKSGVDINNLSSEKQQDIKELEKEKSQKSAETSGYVNAYRQMRGQPVKPVVNETVQQTEPTSDSRPASQPVQPTQSIPQPTQQVNVGQKIDENDYMKFLASKCKRKY